MSFRFFTLFLLVHLIPIWSFEYFLTQDGPIHLANAWSFFHYFDGSNEILREYYIRNPLPAPNWLSQVFLGFLMQFVRPETAEKLLASGFVLVMPTSVWYAADALRKGNGHVALFACPLIFTWFLNTGLYNFCYGVAIYLLLFGYWFRIRDDVKLRSAVVLCVGLVVLYFTHIFALMALFVTLALMIVGERRSLGRRFVFVGGAALPAIVLSLVFIYGKRGRSGPPISSADGLIDRLDTVLSQGVFVSYRSEEVFLYAVFFLLLAAAWLRVVQHVVKRRLWRDGLFLLIPAVFLLLYFVVPAWALQGAFIPDRLLFVAGISAVVALAIHWPKSRSRNLMAGVTGAVSLLLLALETTSMAIHNERLEAVLACEQTLEPGTTLLPIRRPSETGFAGSDRLDPLRHVTHYWVIEHRLVNLGNFSGYRGNHPMLYRANVAPLPRIGCLDCNPPRFDISGYVDASEARVDYVLLRGLDATPALRRDYISVCLQDEDERIELLRRRSAASSPPQRGTSREDVLLSE